MHTLIADVFSRQIHSTLSVQGVQGFIPVDSNVWLSRAGGCRVGAGAQSCVTVSAKGLWMDDSLLLPKRWTPEFPVKRSRKAPFFYAHK